MATRRADVRVAAASVPPGGALVVPVDDRLTIAIFQVEDAFYAVDHACPHKGGPLGEGSLDGAVVTCPWHGFTVDVRTGRCPRNPGLRVPTFPVAREGDVLRVTIPPAGP
jgi:nitrite reductase (NADH) small subunit/3-phenylpropionate/trans-cinnamate dioxygenase ferredoxin subunit